MLLCLGVSYKLFSLKTWCGIALRNTYPGRIGRCQRLIERRTNIQVNLLVFKLVFYLNLHFPQGIKR